MRTKVTVSIVISALPVTTRLHHLDKKGNYTLNTPNFIEIANNAML